EVLSDPDKRKRYDMVGPDFARYAQAGNGGGQPGNFRWTYNMGSPGGAEFGDAGAFSDFFRTLFGDQGGMSGTINPEDLFGRTGSSRARTRRGVVGHDIEHELEVTLPEAYKGVEQQLEIRDESG